MKVRICKNQQEWNNHLISQEQAEFLQSWQWGEFQESVGKEVLRCQLVENNEVVGQFQGFEQNLGFGVKYLYIPREGGRGKGKETFLLKFLKEKKYSFIRFEPTKKLQITDYQLLITKNRQPQNTLILNLKKTEEDLLKQMHSKTRYNIRLADKKGVEIRQEKDIDIFWKLNQETTGRDEFKSHGREYYKKMLDMGICHQLNAWYNGEVIASNIFIKFGDTFTYLHGASSNQDRNVMAPYLLQWQGIKLAKEMGCKYYDFWGIAPVNGGDIKEFNSFSWDANHFLSGVTRFKAGFGKERKDYPSAVDVVFKKYKYLIYKLARKIKGLK